MLHNAFVIGSSCLKKLPGNISSCTQGSQILGEVAGTLSRSPWHLSYSLLSFLRKETHPPGSLLRKYILDICCPCTVHPAVCLSYLAGGWSFVKVGDTMSQTSWLMPIGKLQSFSSSVFASPWFSSHGLTSVWMESWISHTWTPSYTVTMPVVLLFFDASQSFSLLSFLAISSISKCLKV